jgi:hypothetical protein
MLLRKASIRWPRSRWRISCMLAMDHLAAMERGWERLRQAGPKVSLALARHEPAFSGGHPAAGSQRHEMPHRH